MENSGGRLVRICVLAAIMMSVLAVGAPVALAQSWWTGYRSFSIQGRDFTNRAAVTLFEDGTGCTARSECTYLDASSPRNGEMMMEPRLFNGSGVVIENDFYSSRAGERSISWPTDKQGNNGWRYSKGITYQLLNDGENYATTYTLETSHHYYDLW